MTLRVNRRRTTRDDYLSQLRESGISAQPGNVTRDSIMVDRPLSVDRLPGFSEGMVSVQDEAPQLAAELLQLQPGQYVLDVCAAPGGKTVHLLEACPGLKQVVALDISPERAALIRENLTRCGVEARIITADAAIDSTWWDGQPFDRILLDAPCTATGVVRRHPDIKLLRKPEDIAQSAAQQRRILQSVWTTLRAGGRLLYATCSVLREENEHNVDWFLRHQPDAREAPLPELGHTATTHGRQLLPGDRGMDGFFYACLTKSA
jgi:16S rRNA (cytosine967-C5)-methyltransferase